MGFTIKSVLAAHATGRKLTETIDETYARIEEHDDPALFLALRPKAEALAAAAALEAAGPEGRALFGVPFAVKDNIDVAGLPTTCACPAFAYRPARSAFVVERLERAGAIPIGKTNLDQFATGLVGVRSPYGVARNALRPDLIPGGSSSGSATAVAAGLAPFSLGTDTAGSGRVPAALNGIVGLKPSLGALSMTGVAPACRTLDTVSIFALDVADAFLAFQSAAGFDPTDPWSRAFPAPTLSAAPNHFRVGVPRPAQRKFFGDRESEAAFARDIARLAALGAEIVEFDMEPFYAVARLLYEGPWVAERYAATKPLIETDPAALHPVTRAIIESARNHDAVSAFEAMYKLGVVAPPDRGGLGRIRHHGRADPTAPLHDRRSRGGPDPTQFESRHLYEFRQSARSCCDRRSLRPARRWIALALDLDRASRRRWLSRWRRREGS